MNNIFKFISFILILLFNIIYYLNNVTYTRQDLESIILVCRFLHWYQDVLIAAYIHPAD